MMGLIEVEEIKEYEGVHKIRNNLKLCSPDEIRSWVETGFLRKSGVIYCKECGIENSRDSVSYGRGCGECGNVNFLDEYTSGIISGYMELVRKKNLGKYYSKVMKKRDSSIKMNEKRMMHHLLMHKDRIDVDKEFIDKIYRRNVI